MIAPDRPTLDDPLIRNGVHLMCDPLSVEDLYERVRSAERRILSDEEVGRLPDGTGLWNADEWRIRSHGADRLVHALSKRGNGLRILDVGCGNGWLSALLQKQGHQVLAIDAFTKELEQAARVFPNGPTFARADLFHSQLPEEAFDVVLFAASIQYFIATVATLERAKELLTPGGEVHIMDSVIYRSKVEAAAAKERSRSYYRNIDVPDMADHYHAHELAAFRGLGDLHILAAPSGMDRTLLRFGRQVSPFTHLVIRRQ